MPTTAKRREWWPQAVECWKSQTYQQRLLLIGCEDADALRSLPSGDGIEVISCPRTKSLGAKRNWINRHTRTPLIAHWDDDDWSHPNRLTDQVERLAVSGLCVTGYRDMEFVGDSGRYLYTGAADYVLGTSLLYRRDWWESHQFGNLNVGEDNQFVQSAKFARQLAVAECRGHMIARDHAGNTSARMYSNKEWSRIT